LKFILKSPVFGSVKVVRKFYFGNQILFFLANCDRKKPICQIEEILLIFVTFIALVVISQTALQIAYGIVIPIYQLIGYIGTFLIFGSIATIVNIRFLTKL